MSRCRWSGRRRFATHSFISACTTCRQRMRKPFSRRWRGTPPGRMNGRLRGILEELHRNPEILIVFNHPMWDEKRIGEALHRQRVSEFLGKSRFAIHALEWNGFRSTQENALAVELAAAAGMPIISGGDRHGKEPNSVVNLTNASNFRAFVLEIRDGAVSELLLMPQQREATRWRLLRSVADVFADNPDHGLRWTRWSDRMFYLCDDGQARPLSEIWAGASAPFVLSGCVRAIRWLDNSRAGTRVDV